MTFKDDGYLIVKNFVNTDELYNIATQTALIGKGNNDNQCPNSQAFYNSPIEMKKFHEGVIDRIEKLTGYGLHKTYCYWRMYVMGAILPVHKDRAACEISGTLFLGGDQWDIFLRDRNGNVIQVQQEKGDLLLYMGCELEHWREDFMLNNHAQLFLHYVDKEGKNVWAKDDHEGAAGGGGS